MWTRFLVLLSRVRAVVSGRRADAELTREIDAHLTLLTEENIRRGMAPDEAHRRARLRFGGVAQLEESQREQRGFPGVDGTLRDVRYALRVLRKSPGFTIVAILTLAVGIGASTTMFSVARAVLLRPLPYREPDRLVRIFEANPLKRWTRNVVAPANFADWQKQNTVFTEIAAYNAANLFLSGGGAEPQRVKASFVTANLMSVLGVEPMLGRHFSLALESRTPLLMLLSAVGFLFLIVCVNLANLQLGRAAGRTREMTVRQALGASRAG